MRDSVPDRRQLPLLAVQVLPPLARLGVGAAASLVVLYLLAQLVYGVFWGELNAVDVQFHGALAPWRTPNGLRTAQIVSAIASLGMVIGVGVVALLVAVLWPSRRARGVTIVVTLLGGVLIVTAMKAALGRVRPDADVPTVGAAFPSGHSFFALCLYGIAGHLIARQVRRPVWKGAVWAFALLLILAVGASRIYLGAHWLTDVAAGYLVAVPWMLGVITTRDWLLGRRRGPTGREVRRAEALLGRAASQGSAVARMSRALLRDPEVRWPRRTVPLLLALLLAPVPTRAPSWLPLPRDADRMAAAAPLLLLSLRWFGAGRMRAHWDGSGDVLLPIVRVRHAFRLLLGRRRPVSSR